MTISSRTPIPTLLVALLAIAAAAQQPARAKIQAPARAAAAIYDTQADARVEITKALAKAAKENQRVLVMFGANWCGWCHKLHEVFTRNAAVRRELLYEYRLVLVDIGQWDKNLDLAKGYGADIKTHGVPFLTVLSANGKPLANQETGSLEKGGDHDPAKVLTFLQKWQAEPADAGSVLDAARARAAAEKKLLFVHIGAPWCGWCHRLEDWMARPKIRHALEKDFIDVKIDQDRMTHGALIAGLLRRGRRGGIPWFVFLRPNLQPVIDSDGPKGNVGFPARPDEIAHFMDMLAQARSRLTDEDLAFIEKSLQPAR